MDTNTTIGGRDLFFIDRISCVRYLIEKKSLLLNIIMMFLSLVLIICPQEARSGVNVNISAENKAIQSSQSEDDILFLQRFGVRIVQKDVEKGKALDDKKYPGVNKEVLEQKIDQNKNTLADFIFDFESHFVQGGLYNSSVRILMIASIAFLALLYYVRKRKFDSTKYSSEISEHDNLSPQETGLKNGQENSDSLYVTIPEVEMELSQCLNQDEVLTKSMLDSITNSLASNNLAESEVTHELSQSNNKMALLEKAFESDSYFSEAGFIQDKEENVQEEELLNENIQPDNLLDSVEEIKYINEMTRFSKMDAFLKLTESDELSVSSPIEDKLENELSDIKINEKVDVFIEEFDQLIFSMTEQTSILEQEPYEVENLIQFKLSIHFIRMLSDMMQATYLNQFSQTIIDFLEDIVDGKTKMTVDILRRLHGVVRFCDHYIHFLKNNHPVNIEM